MLKYLTFAPNQGAYKAVLLTKSLVKQNLLAYVTGIESEVIAYQLPSIKTPKKTEILAYMRGFFPVVMALKPDYLIVTDAAYFKILTGSKRVDRILGYVLPCVLPDFEHLHVIYAPAPETLLRDPTVKARVDQALFAYNTHKNGTYTDPGSNIVHFEAYPTTVEEIAMWLEKLLDVPLTVDIETYALKHYRSGIGTITMCWSEHEGIAFAIDKDNDPNQAKQIRILLKAFFEARTAQTIYHRSWFDVYILVYQLFMKDVLDQEGLLHGLDVLLRNFDDTMILRYLATNSCAGNDLSLKAGAQEFLGNYAVEVKDISAVPLNVLLRYNLYDGLGTWYVYNKHYPQVIQDQQEDIYLNLFKPMLYDIIQMQLTGLPLDMAEVQRGKALLQQESDRAKAAIMASPEAAATHALLAQNWATQRNLELKKKRVTPADFTEELNINSNLQLQMLLHDVMMLPVIDTTDSGQAATGMDSLKTLKAHCTTAAQIQLLDDLVAYKEVDKLLTSFIPAFEEAHQAPDGWHYLYGVFNPGGTLSGRLSSSDPNLQNLPATGTQYAKLIKGMFRAPKGKLFIGLDFNSLEDVISALTTKDPNKLAVYTDSFDGHSLRAYTYFRDQMPDIERAPEGARCFKANVGGADVYFHAEEQIEYLGQTMRGIELYELLACQGI